MNIKLHKLVFLTLVCFHTQMKAQELNGTELSLDSLPEFDCIIEPGEVIDVGTAMPGVIEDVFVDIGDLVKKGMPLSKLDLSVERASLELARAKAGSTVNIELRKEQADFTDRSKERSDQLYAKSLISSQNIDQLVTEQRVAQLQLREANDQSEISKLDYLRISELLKRGTIRSPIDGVVMERFKSAGEYVKDTPLMRIAQLDPLHVEIIVPVEYFGIITTGIQAEVTPSVFGYTSRRATVERIDRVADTASGTFGVRLNLPNPDHKIPGGLRCKMEFVPNSMEVEAESQSQIAVEDTTEVDANSTDESELVESGLSTLPQSSLPEASLASVNKISENPPDLQCYSIGPVANEEVVKALLDDLRDGAESLSMREEKHVDIQDYVVLSKQQKDRASLSKLKARYKKAGIKNIHVIGAGNTVFANRISLGAFSVRANADSHQARLAKLGFDLEVVARQKERSDYWLDLSLVDSKENNSNVHQVVKQYSTKSAVTSIACETKSSTPLLHAQRVLPASNSALSSDEMKIQTLNKLELTNNIPQSPLPLAPLTSENTPDLQCYSIGPVANEEVVKALSDDLRDGVESLSMREEKHVDIQDYVVLSKQQKDRALLLKLKARYKKAGIKNIYVMGVGNTVFANRISLGAFRVRANADSHQARLAKLGFDLEVVARQKESSDYWLDLSLVDSIENTSNVHQVVKHFSTKSAVTPIVCDPKIASNLTQDR